MWKPPNPLESPPRRNQRAKDSLSINVHVPANNHDMENVLCMDYKVNLSYLIETAHL